MFCLTRLSLLHRFGNKIKTDFYFVFRSLNRIFATDL